MSKVLLLLSLFIGPKESIDIATSLAGCPELADDLRAIAWRESRMEAIGIHESDKHLDGYWGQVRLNERDKARGVVEPGHIDANCQDHGTAQGRWATHGVFGLSAAAHWPYLPKCYKPEYLDIPLVAAFVAIRKYKRICLGRRMSRGWCRIPKKFRKNDPRRNNGTLLHTVPKRNELPPRGESLIEWMHIQVTTPLGKTLEHMS